MGRFISDKEMDALEKNESAEMANDPSILRDVIAPVKAVVENPADVAMAATRGVMRPITSIFGGPQGQEAYEMFTNAPVEFGKRVVGRIRGTSDESLNPIDVLGTTLGRSEALTHRLQKTAPGVEAGIELGTVGLGLASMFGKGRQLYKAIEPTAATLEKELFTSGSKLKAIRTRPVRIQEIVAEEPVPREVGAAEPLTSSEASDVMGAMREGKAAPSRPVKMPKGPAPTKDDAAILKLKKSEMADNATVEDVAYYRRNRGRIESGPSLDERSPNAMSNDVINDIDSYDRYLSKLENMAGKIIENSEATVTRGELAAIFESKISKIKSSGRVLTKSGKSAMRDLQGYIDDLNPVVEGDDGSITMPYEDDPVNGKMLRQYVQGLWEDNKAAYTPGKETSFFEKSLTNVIGDINKRLKAEVGPTYEGLMDVYSKDVQNFKTLKKEFKLGEENIPRMKGWFKNRFMYHFQELEFGNRSANDPMVKALQRLGQIADKDYAMMVKDQLVFGRIFPEQAGGLQRGTASAVWSRAADQALRGGGGINIRTIMNAADYAKSKAAGGLLGEEPGILGSIVKGTTKAFTRTPKKPK